MAQDRVHLGHGEPGAAPRRSVEPRRSTSRGARILEHRMAVPRALSRGKAEHAGSRRVKRWLNDHLIFSWQNAWEGLGEEQIAERLDHMFITPSSGPSLVDRLTTLAERERDLAVRFRRGELREREATAGGHGQGRLTAAGLLSAMYGRVDPRLRPYLLKECRRVPVVPGGGTGGKGSEPAESFILHAEILMMKILDGVLAKEVQEYVSSECASALSFPVPGLEPPSPLPWTSSSSEWSYACTGPVQGEQGGGQGVFLAPIMSSYLRMVVHGVASFYGIRAESVPLSACPGLRSWAGQHGQVGPHGGRRGRAQAESEPLVLKLSLPSTEHPNAQLMEQGVSALRYSLASDLGGAGPGQTAGEEEEEAEGSAPSSLPPLVPLLQVHVRSITREASEQGLSSTTPADRPLPSAHAGQFSYGKQYKLAAGKAGKGKGKGGGSSVRTGPAGSVSETKEGRE